MSLHTTCLLQKIKYYIVYGKMFFLIIHFLGVEGYELPTSTSYVLTLPLTLECVITLS